MALPSSERCASVALIAVQVLRDVVPPLRSPEKIGMGQLCCCGKTHSGHCARQLIKCAAEQLGQLAQMGESGHRDIVLPMAYRALVHLHQIGQLFFRQSCAPSPHADQVASGRKVGMLDTGHVASALDRQVKCHRSKL